MTDRLKAWAVSVLAERRLLPVAQGSCADCAGDGAGGQETLHQGCLQHAGTCTQPQVEPLRQLKPWSGLRCARCVGRQDDRPTLFRMRQAGKSHRLGCHSKQGAEQMNAIIFQFWLRSAAGTVHLFIIPVHKGYTLRPHVSPQWERDLQHSCTPDWRPRQKEHTGRPGTRVKHKQNPLGLTAHRSQARKRVRWDNVAGRSRAGRKGPQRGQAGKVSGIENAQ